VFFISAEQRGSLSGLCNKVSSCDVVSSEEVYWSSGSITSVGLTIVVNNIVIHVLFLVEILVISRVTIGKSISVASLVVGVQQSLIVLRSFLFHLTKLHEVGPNVKWVDIVMSGADNRVLRIVLILELFIISSITVTKEV